GFEGERDLMVAVGPGGVGGPGGWGGGEGEEYGGGREAGECGRRLGHGVSLGLLGRRMTGVKGCAGRSDVGATTSSGWARGCRAPTPPRAGNASDQTPDKKGS